jgi:hypothetical protein
MIWIMIILFLFFTSSGAWAKEDVKMAYFHVPPHISYDASTKKIRRLPSKTQCGDDSQNTAQRENRTGDFIVHPLPDGRTTMPTG